jgi:hypothetical protein
LRTTLVGVSQEGERNMSARRIAVVLGLSSMFVALAVVAALQVGAQSPSSAEDSHAFVADGFQADGSSPLILQGDPIGRHAVWRRVRGPVVGDVFGPIPGLPGSPPFDGASCRAEYGEGEIVTRHRGTLRLNVWGYRCEPDSTEAAAAGAHLTSGIFSIQGGTGPFQDVVGGTGSIQIVARLDGSVDLRIVGSIRRVGDAYRPF